MIASMTAFSRQSIEAEWGSLTWELRSVNHRYLEVSLRLPEALRSLETKLRERIQKQLKRGKVDASLKFKPGEQVPFDFVVNKNLVAQLAEANTQVASLFPDIHVNLMDVLTWQGVLQTKDTRMEAVGQAALELLTVALDDLIQMRCREGTGLETFLNERLNDINHDAEEVTKKMPGVLESNQDRVKQRFDELNLELDQGRLEQEMVWLAQKLDVAEELQRLKAHVIEVQSVLKKGGVVGRRLDFLMQELNREANTLASKSINAEITKSVVNMKVQIEQMREQVQNIE